MDKKQLTKDLNFLLSVSNQIDIAINFGFSLECGMLDTFSRLYDKYIDELASKYNLFDGFFQWFIFENDFGKDQLSIIIDGKEYLIDSIKSFVDLSEQISNTP